MRYKATICCQGNYRPGLARDAELSLVGKMDFDLVALFQLERVDDRGGEANRQAVAPFRDLHGPFKDIRFKNVYPRGTAIKGFDDPVKRVTPHCAHRRPCLPKGGSKTTAQCFVKRACTAQIYSYLHSPLRFA
jgi:hypothetical protein